MGYLFYYVQKPSSADFVCESTLYISRLCEKTSLRSVSFQSFMRNNGGTSRMRLPQSKLEVDGKPVVEFFHPGTPARAYTQTAFLLLLARPVLLLSSSFAAARQAYVLLLCLIFNDFYQTDYLKIYRTDLRQFSELVAVWQ